MGRIRALLGALAVCGIFAGISASPALAEKRVALVIGNDRYANLPADRQLLKAVNDAEAMGDALAKLGFTVIRGQNLGRQGMIDKLSAFTAQLAAGDTAAFFYAGHGVAIGGVNYLVPSDVPSVTPDAEARVRGNSIAEGDVVAEIQGKGARVALLVLDACRDNPFPRSGTRSIGNTRGLADAKPARGVFTIYSAGIGQTALDRLEKNDPERNSVFTRVFVQQLARTDLHLGDLIVEVREKVAALALRAKNDLGQIEPHEQTPAYYDQTIGGRVYLAGRAIGVEPKAQTAPAAPPAAESKPENVTALQERLKTLEEQLKQGEDPKVAALFASKCNNCHATHLGLAKGKNSAALTNFLRFHFAESNFEVAALVEFLLSAIPPSVHQKVAIVAPPVAPATPPSPVQPAVGVFPSTIKVNPLSPERERALKAKDSFKECDVCPEMVVAPAGSFTMGSPANEENGGKDEGPQHRVTIARLFAVGKFEVTVDQFAAFVTETGYDAGSACRTFEGGKAEERSGRSFRNPGFAQAVSHPAACLNWHDAKAYVTWLSKKTGKAYRLLTEAEWEFTGRAGTTTRYHFGDNESGVCGYGNSADQKTKATISGADKWTVAPCNDGYAYTAPVGSFSTNGFGLHDMHGNVWEWTEDCYNDSYRGAPTDGSAWTSGDCNRHVVRGGSWSIRPWYLRSALRNRITSDFRDFSIGLRVARTLVQ